MADRVALEALLSWAGDVGVECPRVRIESRPGRGRCLVAAHSCAEGDRLLLVPARASLADREDDGRANHVMLGLAQLLIREDKKGPESAWAPFIQLLFGHAEPAYPIEKCMRFPSGAGVFAQVRHDRNTQFVGKLCSVHPSLSREKAALAVEVVNNRAVYCEKQKVCALLPIFDMMNHDARPNAQWTMDEDFGVTVSARRAIAAGEEVMVSYGDDPNAELFIAYGFALREEGPHQCVDLSVSLHPPELQRYGSNCTAQLRVLANGGIKYRAALAPLVKAAREFVQLSSQEGACQRHEYESVLAEAINRCAQAERSAWLKVLASAEDRDTLAPLVEVCMAALTELMARIDAWSDGSKADSMMVALSGAPASTEGTASSSGSDSDSEGMQ